MISWQKFADGETPESKKIKGDHFVGEYYVAFEAAFKKEYVTWQESNEGRAHFKQNAKEGEDPQIYFKRYKNTYFNEVSALGKEAKNLLKLWEAGDPETMKLWNQMNLWVYAGFDETYEALGVTFDKVYTESDTYLIGKEIVHDKLDEGLFFKKADGSVWIDLEDVGLDKKLVLRSDGTSVYITQDIGTAEIRHRDFWC